MGKSTQYVPRSGNSMNSSTIYHASRVLILYTLCISLVILAVVDVADGSSCGDFHTCDKCLADTICGWCGGENNGTTSACLLGDGTGPSSGTPCLKWYYGQGACSVLCKGADGQNPTCNECLGDGKDEKCVWCPSSSLCLEKSMSSSCPTTHSASEKCPSSAFLDTEKGIIVVSIAGFLGAAIIASAGAITYRWYRKNRKRQKALAAYNQIYYSLPNNYDKE